MQSVFPIALESAVFSAVEAVPAPANNNGMGIQIVDPEFSSVCPRTGLPDFGRVILRYIPQESIVELKSWKLFLRDFYGVGIMHEAATQKILEAFVHAVIPREAYLVIDWGARGGLHTTTALQWSPETGFTTVITAFLDPVMADAAVNWQNQ